MVGDANAHTNCDGKSQKSEDYHPDCLLKHQTSVQRRMATRKYDSRPQLHSLGSQGAAGSGIVSRGAVNHGHQHQVGKAQAMIRAEGADNDAVILPWRPLMRAHGADCRRPIDAGGHESAMAAHDDHRLGLRCAGDYLGRQCHRGGLGHFQTGGATQA